MPGPAPEAFDDGSGSAVADQLPDVIVSIKPSDWLAPPASLYEPTATQKLADVQVTPFSTTPGFVAGPLPEAFAAGSGASPGFDVVASDQPTVDVAPLTPGVIAAAAMPRPIVAAAAAPIRIRQRER